MGLGYGLLNVKSNIAGETEFIRVVEHDAVSVV